MDDGSFNVLKQHLFRDLFDPKKILTAVNLNMKSPWRACGCDARAWRSLIGGGAGVSHEWYAGLRVDLSIHGGI